jgi:tetratricopeptide (TPR) repeat protein
MVHAHQDNVAEVEQLVKILIKQESIASDFLDAMKDIGWGYFCAGRLDEAVAIYRQGITRHPDHSAAVYLQYHVVQACLKKSDPKAADREMEMLLTQYGHRPNTPALACRLAKEYRQKGYAQQEIAVYQSLLERFPEHEEGRLLDSIVETYTDAGDWTKAIEALKIKH